MAVQKKPVAGRQSDGDGYFGVLSESGRTEADTWHFDTIAENDIGFGEGERQGVRGRRIRERLGRKGKWRRKRRVSRVENHLAQDEDTKCQASNDHWVGHVAPSSATSLPHHLFDCQMTWRYEL